jgi:TetR/AcrR family transcriptional regulator, mexJK operon transcriptional repressor
MVLLESRWFSRICCEEPSDHRVVMFTCQPMPNLSVLEYLAETFLEALMYPGVLQISSADRFPEIATAWYERGFERALGALAKSFPALTDRQLLAVDDPVTAAEYFVGMLFRIPVNKAMFTGNDDYAATHDLEPVAKSAARAFMNAYGVRA